MKKSLFEQIILYDYRYLIGYISLLLVALYGLFWRLGTLLPGLSNYEAEYLTNFDQTLGSITNNPLYWPHKMLSQLATEWLGANELAARLPSALLGLAGLALFFIIIRHRFKGRVAMVGVLLLSTSSWWLASARLARPEIILPVMMLLIALLARMTVETHKGHWLVLLGVAIGIAFYVPLLPYIVIIGSIVGYSIIRKTAAEFETKWKMAFYLVLLGLLAPLGAAIIQDVEVGRELLSMPIDWPSFSQYTANIKEIIASIFWSAREFAPLNLGTLPFLDIFTVAMLILGFYYLDHEISRSLTQFLIFGLIALLLILGTNPQPGFTIVLIPFIYTLVAAGIVMLFSQWYEIFPKNPIARMAVFLPTIFLLGAVVWYHHTRYFVAAPSSPSIIKAFPPLSAAIGDFLDIAGTDSQSVILTTNDEMLIAQAAARTHSAIQITSVASAALGQSNLAITHEAYKVLDPGDVQLVKRAELQALYSPYSTSPIVLWYTTVE